MINLICIASLWTNLTALPWNNHDFKTYHNVQQRCANDPRYKNDTPCVKTFTKTYEQGYRVVCGIKRFSTELPIFEVKGDL